ncbi:MAG: hypothetical protein AB7P04_04350 [Bacteriovoracia bacterium]
MKTNYISTLLVSSLFTMSVAGASGPEDRVEQKASELASSVMRFKFRYARMKHRLTPEVRASLVNDLDALNTRLNSIGQQPILTEGEAGGLGDIFMIGDTSIVLELVGRELRASISSPRMREPVLRSFGGLVSIVSGIVAGGQLVVFAINHEHKIFFNTLHFNASPDGSIGGWVDTNGLSEKFERVSSIGGCVYVEVLGFDAAKRLHDYNTCDMRRGWRPR